MPNFDGGHYFLTVLAPVRTDMVDQDGPSDRSHEQLLRHALACLPTAQQTRITANSGKNSPFARNIRTHLARFAVLDNLSYNGRKPGDAVASAITGKGNPLVPQPVDRLNCPYLLFAVDFDAATDSESELESYLGELWADMEDELRSIFGHCVGFENVSSAGAFIFYIKKCQIETTMPFNDYWREAPPLSNAAVSRLFWMLAIPAALLPWVVDYLLVAHALPWGVKALISLLLVIGAAYGAVMRVGNRPFPTAPDSDLKSVLKALYLQQKFSEFVIANQGRDAAELQANFADFMATHHPHDLDNPTQKPGVISANQGASS